MQYVNGECVPNATEVRAKQILLELGKNDELEPNVRMDALDEYRRLSFTTIQEVVEIKEVYLNFANSKKLDSETRIRAACAILRGC